MVNSSNNFVKLAFLGLSALSFWSCTSISDKDQSSTSNYRNKIAELEELDIKSASPEVIKSFFDESSNNEIRIKAFKKFGGVDFAAKNPHLQRYIYQAKPEKIKEIYGKTGSEEREILIKSISQEPYEFKNLCAQLEEEDKKDAREMLMNSLIEQDDEETNIIKFSSFVTNASDYGVDLNRQIEEDYFWPSIIASNHKKANLLVYYSYLDSPKKPLNEIIAWVAKTYAPGDELSMKIKLGYQFYGDDLLELTQALTIKNSVKNFLMSKYLDDMIESRDIRIGNELVRLLNIVDEEEAEEIVTKKSIIHRLITTFDHNEEFANLLRGLLQNSKIRFRLGTIAEYDGMELSNDDIVYILQVSHEASFFKDVFMSLLGDKNKFYAIADFIATIKDEIEVKKLEYIALKRCFTSGRIGENLSAVKNKLKINPYLDNYLDEKNNAHTALAILIENYFSEYPYEKEQDYSSLTNYIVHFFKNKIGSSWNNYSLEAYEHLLSLGVDQELACKLLDRK